MGDQSLVALLAPVSEMRGIKTLAAEQGADGPGFVRRIGGGALSERIDAVNKTALRFATGRSGSPTGIATCFRVS
jgi:hypothetical protein